MFYIKSKDKDDSEIKIVLNDDDIFTNCVDCDAEIEVDNDLLISILQEDGFDSSTIVCESCTAKRNASS